MSALHLFVLSFSLSLFPCPPCSRSVELNGYTAALREQYIGSAVAQHYQFLPHLFGYTAQPRSLYPQSHTLISQLVAAEELAPLGTPMLIEDG